MLKNKTWQVVRFKKNKKKLFIVVIILTPRAIWSLQNFWPHPLMISRELYLLPRAQLCSICPNPPLLNCSIKISDAQTIWNELVVVSIQFSKVSQDVIGPTELWFISKIIEKFARFFIFQLYHHHNREYTHRFLW